MFNEFFEREENYDEEVLMKKNKNAVKVEPRLTAVEEPIEMVSPVTVENEEVVEPEEVTVFPEEHIVEVEKPILGKVIGGKLNLRDNPNGKVLTQLENDSTVEILSMDDREWFNVKATIKGVEIAGFVKSEFLVIVK